MDQSSNNMQNAERSLRASIAALESKVDMLESELEYLNAMLVRCGFPEGIVTLKMTVEELLAEEADCEQHEEGQSSFDRY